ncbi:hypothetical protein [Leifsonia aquatica]|uniref:hypothetical protein n=1 Tax=Leifsonia aquatica TaxID=144185 RepID=UPI003802D2FF
MPVLPIGPGTLTIGAETDLTNFAGKCTSAKLVPSVKRGDKIQLLDGSEEAGDRTESFALEGKFLQDFGQADSKTEWLFEHRGEEHPFVYRPNNGSAKSITGTLTVEAIDMGGDVGEKPVSDFSFELVGAPTIAAAGAGFAAFSVDETGGDPEILS